jgi:hypothetical protein
MSLTQPSSLPPLLLDLKQMSVLFSSVILNNLVMLISSFLFGSSSQIGKVRQASLSIHPNTTSLVLTTCADLRLLVLLPRRVHDAVVRSSLNSSRGGSPLFTKFCAHILANPMIFGNRFTQYGRRRKRSVSLLSLDTGGSFRLTTSRPFSSLPVHSGTIAIS